MLMRGRTPAILLLCAALTLLLAVGEWFFHDRRWYLRLLRLGVLIYAGYWIYLAVLNPARSGKHELALTLFRRLRDCFATPYGFFESLRRWAGLGYRQSGFHWQHWWMLDDVWKNLVVLTPAGVLLPSAFPSLRGRRFPWPAVGVIALWSLLTELTQFMARRGSCDINDLITNALSGLAGAACWLLVRRLRARRAAGLPADENTANPAPGDCKTGKL